MSKHMKDSGTTWFGKIPNNWELIKAKYIFAQKSERGNNINLQLLSPTQKFGVIPQSKYEELTGMNAVKLNQNVNLALLKTIHKGAFCISLRSFQGGFEYSKYEGVVSPAYQVFYPTVKIADGYYKYLFKDQSFIDKMNSYTISLRDGKNISFEDFGNTFIPFPPLKQQQRIADYLDKKCTEVEGLSNNIQKQIEALEQYKRAVITEAVTKGLNPSAPMKDSGIPWVGQSPAHWGIKRIKFCCELSPKFHNRLSPNTLVSFLPMECVKQGFLVIEKEAELQDVKNGYTYFRENDIIMAKVTPCFENGNIAIAKGLLNNVGFGSSELYVFRPHKISVPFLFYFLQNTIFKNQAQSVMYGTGGLKRVPSEFIKNYQFACPPQSEQQAIAEYLDNKCSKIDTIIQDKQQQLEKLEQYKKAIIFEYVTGKKQVPEA